MLAIARYEFIQLFKSIKTIFVVASFLLMSYGLARLQNAAIGLLGSDVGSPAEVNDAIVTFFLLAIFGIGFLYIFSLSHDRINGEIQTQNIRFSLTKMSREALYTGKFIGFFSFWTICLLVCLLILFFVSSTNMINVLLPLFLFLAYAIALNLFLSTIIPKPGMSLFLGLFIGLAAPIASLTATFREDLLLLLTIHEYVLPYNALLHLYEHGPGALTFVPILWTGLFFFAGLFLLKRKDL
ncbi:hypothetical protein G4V62_10580 [Bacillaceae bacterium SIJ1]|uniref:ABC transporter permease subunit n=1 Tax=Litoribacterium kuwaitense TaxID=1398745 RepID=UPI0013EA920E|nr:ABC transporter permease subunit [Litoribacterium kuwaitense]NGP45377.1 hypothetical protein [Litoribacterium kuwaitense]